MVKVFTVPRPIQSRSCKKARIALIYLVYRNASSDEVVKVTDFLRMNKDSQRKCQVTGGITTDPRYVPITKAGR